MISRRPDALTNPQFWAEDGNVFYAGMYNNGNVNLIINNVVIFSPIYAIAAFSQLFSLEYGPLIFTLFALFFQILPVLLFMSSRFEKLIPKYKTRIILVLTYLCLFNVGETYMNLTNSLYYLALSAFIIIISEPSENKYWNWFDFVILIIASIPFTFAVFLIPIALIRTLKGKSKISLYKLLTLIVVIGVQIIARLHAKDMGVGGRTLFPEMTLSFFWDIFIKQIVWGAIGGQNGYVFLIKWLPLGQMFFTISGIFALILGFYTLIKGPQELKLFILFSGVFLAACLIIPNVPGNRQAWKVLAEAYGMRYWLLPTLAFLFCIVWGSSKKNASPIRIISLFFMSFFVFFLIKHFFRPGSFRFSPYVNYYYQEEVDKFLRLPRGESYVFPINPPGWTMTLVRK